MTVNARCTRRTKCGARKTYARDPEKGYLHLPKCPGCGKRTMRADPSVGRQTRKRTCYCEGIRFPHRRGTVIDLYRICVYADPAELLDKGIITQEQHDEWQDDPDPAETTTEPVDDDLVPDILAYARGRYK